MRKRLRPVEQTDIKVGATLINTSNNRSVFILVATDLDSSLSTEGIITNLVTKNKFIHSTTKTELIRNWSIEVEEEESWFNIYKNKNSGCFWIGGIHSTKTFAENKAKSVALEDNTYIKTMCINDLI